MQTQVVLEKKKGLLHLFRVDQVIVFYPKTMNKWQSKNDQEIFRDQIFIQRIVNFLFRSEKRTSLLQVRNCVVVSYMLYWVYILRFKGPNWNALPPSDQISGSRATL